MPEINGKGHLLIPPPLFRHRNLLSVLESSQTINQEGLVNRLNYLHFSHRPINAILQHEKYEEYICIKVYPEPCRDDEIVCRWEEGYIPYLVSSYQLKYLLIPKESSVILVPLSGVKGTDKTFSAPLPDRGYVLNERQTARFTCEDISVELAQNGFMTGGKLIDFSHRSFRVQVMQKDRRLRHWYNPDDPATVRLFANGKTFFHGLCYPLHRRQNGCADDIVFLTQEGKIARIPPKKVRNPRRKITPPLLAVFEHPFLKKRIERKVYDLSVAGFSVEDDSVDSILMVGMMIPNLCLLHAGLVVVTCNAQIIHKQAEGDKLLYGVFFTDMDLHSYDRLNNLLGAYTDPHLSFATEIDVDELWEFFFESGFIYPGKYGSLQAYQKDFLDTYRKLYEDYQEIARHVCYRERGRIYGHLSMLRAYERTWLIHHHAARPLRNILPGFAVLKYFIAFLQGAATLPSARMDYVMCFFRPDNEFPNRIFGLFARELNKPRLCSLDTFAYLVISPACSRPLLREGWSLKKLSPVDMWELDNFYRRSSGGLFLDILQQPSLSTEEPVREIFQRYGFTRDWQLYGLYRESTLVCAAVVNRSDLGLNLSDILNSITVIVLNEELLPREELMSAALELAQGYGIDRVPLLIYPDRYADSAGINCEKKYDMWIADMQHINLFTEYLYSRFRMRYE